jgi:hypothetical protein
MRSGFHAALRESRTLHTVLVSTTMTKPISTRTHGIIDYGWAGAATALAKRADHATATARLLRSAAAIASASSAMTNYEYGALRMIPMRGHLAIDFALCSALMVAPLFLPPSERRYALLPAALGMAGIVTAFFTRPRSPLELGDEFGGLYGGGREVSMVADQDPDVAVSPHLRRHLE